MQGGGFVAEGDDVIVQKLEGLRGRILNEATASLPNRVGTVTMARLAEPNTARHMNVVHRIGSKRTTSKSDLRNVPRETIVIRSITQIETN